MRSPSPSPGPLPTPRVRVRLVRVLLVPVRLVHVRLVRVLLLSVLVSMLVTASWAAAAQPQLPSPSRWPLDGPIRQLRGFAPPQVRWAAGHRGIDLAAEPGQAVLAAADGTVTFAGPLAGRGVVVVRHGVVRTTYEPVTAAVRVGSRVKLGQRLGAVAVGGHCAGSCLHWGLREDKTYLDPALLSGQRTRVRLLARSDRGIAVRRAAQRAAAEQLALRAAAVPSASSVVSGLVGLSEAASRAHQGWVIPVPGPVTSGFGMRLHPVLGVWKLHDGTDFAASCGTPITATAAGTVLRRSVSPGYGNQLVVAHNRVAGVAVRTAYNHAERFVVRAGEAVRQGQVVGFVGNTGYSTGCHLHLLMWRDGRLTNPMTWLAR